MGFPHYSGGSFTGTLLAGTQFLAPFGSGAAPSYSFAGDTDTGMFRAAANTLDLVTFTTTQLRISTLAITAFLPLYFSADNANDIGESATTLRPRNLYLAGYLAGSVQSLSGPGAVNLTTMTTAFTSTGASDALTLADGVVGQMKEIIHVVDGGSGVLTPTNLFNGSTLTFADLGDSVILRFIGTEWHVIANNGVALA